MQPPALQPWTNDRTRDDRPTLSRDYRAASTPQRWKKCTSRC